MPNQLIDSMESLIVSLRIRKIVPLEMRMLRRRDVLLTDGSGLQISGQVSENCVTPKFCFRR